MSESSKQFMLDEQTRLAAKNLLEADESHVYEELGLRLQAVKEDFSISSAFDTSIVYNEAEMGFMSDLQTLGKRMFRRLERQMFDLLCGSKFEDKDARNKLANAFNIGDAEVAGVISTLLVTQLGMAPIFALPIAVIIVKRFFNPVYEEFCSFWSDTNPGNG